MKPAPFEYHAPDSIEEALALVHDLGDEAKLLAGGQSLVPAMNFRVVQPSVLIDLNRVHELNYLHEDLDCIRIGAMTRERTLELNPLVSKKFPLLAEAMPYVAHPQIRNRGTLGGSLANADPAAELPVLMLALNARMKVGSAESERWVDAQNFFAGMFVTDMAPNEMLVEIELPAQPSRTGWSFMEVAPRAGDYALMGVAALVTLDENGKCEHARLVYLNAGDGPVDAIQSAQLLKNETLNNDLINAAAVHASEKEINPFGNVHASSEFQRHLANVLTKKALKESEAKFQLIVESVIELAACPEQTGQSVAQLPAGRWTTAPAQVDPKLWSGLRFRMIGPFRGGRSTAVTGVAEQPSRHLRGFREGDARENLFDQLVLVHDARVRVLLAGEVLELGDPRVRVLVRVVHDGAGQDDCELLVLLLEALAQLLDQAREGSTLIGRQTSIVDCQPDKIAAPGQLSQGIEVGIGRFFARQNLAHGRRINRSDQCKQPRFAQVR